MTCEAIIQLTIGKVTHKKPEGNGIVYHLAFRSSAGKTTPRWVQSTMLLEFPGGQEAKHICACRTSRSRMNTRWSSSWQSRSLGQSCGIVFPSSSLRVKASGMSQLLLLVEWSTWRNSHQSNNFSALAPRGSRDLAGLTVSNSCYLSSCN